VEHFSVDEWSFHISHGWSDAALGVAEPVEAGFLFSLLAPEGQRSRLQCFLRPCRGGSVATPVIHGLRFAPEGLRFTRGYTPPPLPGRQKDALAICSSYP